MSKIRNAWLDQYGAEPFEQQQFGTSGVEGVNKYFDFDFDFDFDLINTSRYFHHAFTTVVR